MSKPNKRRLEKKKKHQREDYKKILNRRKKIRAEAKADKERWKLERETRIRMEPIVKNKPKPHARTPEEIEIQIGENLKALQLLEKEYEQEVSSREGLNKSLEDEGFVTLKEKMDFLGQQAQEQAKASVEKQKFKGKKII